MLVFQALDAAREANERASLGERAFGSPQSRYRSSRPPRLPQRRTRLRLVDWQPTNRQDFVCSARLPFRGHITAQKRTHSTSNFFQEEWTFGTIVLFVCELDGTIDMPLQSRLIASGFPMLFPIDCNDSINNVAAQEALPSIKAASRAFGIFQLSGHHEAVTTKAVHLAPLSRIKTVAGTMAH